MVVMSLSLSLILLNSMYTIVTGFDMDKFLSAYILSDFAVADASILNFGSPYVEYEGVTEDFLKELEKQDGVEDVGNVYVSGNYHVYSEAEWEQMERIMENPLFSGWFGEEVREKAYDEIRKEKAADTDIYGINEAAAKKLILPDEDAFDWETFQSGDYVLVNAMDSVGEMKEVFDFPFAKPGDKVTLTNYDGKTKEYEVLCVAQIPSALSTQRYPLIPE